MKIVSYNIQYGLGQDARYDLKRIADEVRAADIIALQEVDRYWSRSGNLDQPAILAKELPEHYWVFAANCDMHPNWQAPVKGQPVDNRRRQFGTMILSKSPILSTRNFPLVKFGAIHQHSIQQGALEAVINTKAGAVRFYSIHLSHLASTTRVPQIKQILDIHHRAYSEGGSWCGTHPEPNSGWLEGGEPPMPRQAMLLGDFNCDYKSPEYDMLIGSKAEKYGRLHQRDGFMDAWVVAGHLEEQGCTHAENGYRIDHCFISPELAPYIKRCDVDLQATGSDHLPLWIETAL